jgi:hypothetical protein
MTDRRLGPSRFYVEVQLLPIRFMTIVKLAQGGLHALLFCTII